MPGIKYQIPFLKNVVTVDAPYHRQCQNLKHCIDFFLPEGTLIRAARRGIVIAIEAKYQKAYRKARYAERTNYIVILHKDREQSWYVHLQHQSIRVKIGELVESGCVIARSGQTGYAWYPHLHFGVYDRKGNNIKIVLPKNKNITLQEACSKS